MEEQLPPNSQLPSEQTTPVPQGIDPEKEGGSNKNIVIVIGVVGVLAVIVAAFAWWRVTTPRTEEQAALPLSPDAELAQSAAEVVCGEVNDLIEGEVANLNSLAINEWYVDPVTPANSFIELKNIAEFSIVTDDMRVIMSTDVNEKITHHGGNIPGIELGPGCLLVVRVDDIAPIGIGFSGGVELFSEPAIVATHLSLGDRISNAPVTRIPYIENLPAGQSVSLSSIGKYVGAPITPGKSNETTSKLSFQPSAEALAYFNEVAFVTFESGEKVIRKWVAKSVPVGLEGEVTLQDEACITGALQELREYTGLELPVQTGSSSQGITINFVSQSEFPPTYKDRNVLTIKYPNITSDGDSGNSFSRSEIYIATDVNYTDDLRCKVVYGELGLAIGVSSRGTSYPDSMFISNAFPPKAGFTALDGEVIRILYDSLVQPGDTAEDIDRIFLAQ